MINGLGLWFGKLRGDHMWSQLPMDDKEGMLRPLLLKEFSREETAVGDNQCLPP